MLKASEITGSVYVHIFISFPYPYLIRMLDDKCPPWQRGLRKYRALTKYFNQIFILTFKYFFFFLVFFSVLNDFFWIIQ